MGGARVTFAPGAGQPAPSSASSDRFTRWIETHKAEATIGAAAVVAAYAWWRSKHPSASTAQAAATAPTIAGQAPTYAAGTGGDYASLTNQIGRMQSQLAAIENPSPTTQTPAEALGAPPALANVQPWGAIDSNQFPMQLPYGSQMSVYAASGGGGSWAPGSDALQGGAPAYALENGQWVQGFNRDTLPPGTLIATLPQFAGLETPMSGIT